MGKWDKPCHDGMRHSSTVSDVVLDDRNKVVRFKCPRCGQVVSAIKTPPPAAQGGTVSHRLIRNPLLKGTAVTFSMALSLLLAGCTDRAYWDGTNRLLGARLKEAWRKRGYAQGYAQGYRDAIIYAIDHLSKEPAR